MMAAAPRTRTGCTSCRVRHLKCDETRPVCRRCQRAGRECVRGYNVRFRYGTDLGDEESNTPATAEAPGGRPAGGKGGEFRFESDQVWIETSGEVSFVDETVDITRNYDTRNSPSNSPASQHAPSPANSSSVHSVSIRNLVTDSSPALPSPSSTRNPFEYPRHRNSITYSPTDGHTLSRELDPSLAGYGSDSAATATANTHGNHHHVERGGIPLEDILSTTQPPSIDDVGMNMHAISAAEEDTGMGGMGGMGGWGHSGLRPLCMEMEDNVTEGLHLQHTTWPLEDIKVAKLLRHYTDNLGQWFDMHDALNHFTTVLPLLSATCPMLLDAILALSARHLSHTTDFDPYVASAYHTSCLKAYIPALSSASGHTLDSALLASTVILRTFEELDVTQAGTDEEHYLLGSSIFGELHPTLAVCGGLRQACFWIYLRQEIYISFVRQRPVKINLDNLQIDRSFSPADDYTWANRITFKCAEILEFTFGDENKPVAANGSSWSSLSRDVDTWRNSRPESFEPIYFSQRDPSQERYFPDIWYTLNCHATGVQYYHLCRILLAIYNPAIPRMGLGLKHATKKLGTEVVDNVRAICGIARSNRPIPAHFTASHAIYVCGEWFEDAGERAAMLQLLDDTAHKKGWPTGAVAFELKAQWGMNDDGPAAGSVSTMRMDSPHSVTSGGQHRLSDHRNVEGMVASPDSPHSHHQSTPRVQSPVDEMAF